MMAGRVRYGFAFDLRNPEPWRRPWADHYAEHLDFIAWSETLGFEQVWIAEHHGDEDGYCPSPLVVASALASRTRTLRLATGIGLAPFYHPTRLAEDAAVLDIISNGRFELALGLGYLPREFAAYGIDVKSRGKRADEILQVLRPLWRGEEVSFQGDYYRLDKARIYPLPVQEGGIPIYIGGAVKAGFRRAAKYGDGYFGPLQAMPGYLEAMRELGRTESEARLSFISAADGWLLCSEDPERDLHLAAPYAHYLYSVYAKWNEEGDFVMPKMDLETFKAAGMFKVFTPDDMVDFIRTKIAPWQVDSFAFQAFPGMPMSVLQPHAELLATKVLPRLR
jgi:alkanesulfonate monooxygenase SsuD/methylene tetrahydromethanopterin reductase-like flavin-dependent oxidoreductase (luciferase family)